MYFVHYKIGLIKLNCLFDAYIVGGNISFTGNSESIGYYAISFINILDLAYLKSMLMN